MNRTIVNETRPRARTGPALAGTIHRVLFALFLLQFALVCARLWLRFPVFGDSDWPEALMLVLATSTVIASLSRQLPAQNVLLAATIIVLIAGTVQAVGALTSIPFGPYVYTDRFARESFHLLPWAVPLLWVVAILTSRGVARLIMRPWHKMRTYGFWVIGITVVLVVLLDLGLEPFATRVKHYWFWNPTKLPFDWYGAPCVNFMGWALTALIILAFTTPSLINKRHTKQRPTYHPLVVWLLVNFLFIVGALVHQLWPVAILIMGAAAVVAALAIRGATW